MIEQVHIFEDWPTMGHRVIIRGRPAPGARAHYLRADGQWEEIGEGTGYVSDDRNLGFTLPEGALDAIVHERLKVAAPQQATERHLEDAISVRDRLLSMVESSAAASPS